MEFRLIYEGLLKSSGNSAGHVKDKHHIRKVFHRQLAELWEQHPVLSKKKTHTLGPNIQRNHFKLTNVIGPATESNILAHLYDRCGFQFVPLVNKWYGVVCTLSILFLRRENPGALIMQGGDIDNRIKTLLDALRIPENCKEVSGGPEADESPFYCLLESDTLVTELNVTTDRLLAPLKTGQHQNEVYLVIHVKVQASAESTKGLESLYRL